MLVGHLSHRLVCRQLISVASESLAAEGILQDQLKIHPEDSVVPEEGPKPETTAQLEEAARENWADNQSKKPSKTEESSASNSSENVAAQTEAAPTAQEAVETKSSEASCGKKVYNAEVTKTPLENSTQKEELRSIEDTPDSAKFCERCTADLAAATRAQMSEDTNNNDWSSSCADNEFESFESADSSYETACSGLESLQFRDIENIPSQDSPSNTEDFSASLQEVLKMLLLECEDVELALRDAASGGDADAAAQRDVVRSATDAAALQLRVVTLLGNDKNATHTLSQQIALLQDVLGNSRNFLESLQTVDALDVCPKIRYLLNIGMNFGTKSDKLITTVMCVVAVAVTLFVYQF